MSRKQNKKVPKKIGDWFQLDDWVWFMDDNKAVQKQIRGIWRYAEKDNQEVYYLFSSNTYAWQADATKIKQAKCFATKEELLKSL